jgi:fructose-bisphosphate aldolase class II
MGLSIADIRENTLRARHLMQRARQQRFAVGAFNIDNQETLIAVARAAKEMNSPVMVEITHDEVKGMGVENVRAMVDNYRREYGIEMYINLDHSPSVEEAKKGIDAGFEFIHIDVSQSNHDATDEEIIGATKEVVEYAKFTGALVESEAHYFGGGSNVFKEKIDYEEVKKTFSTPEGVKAFVDATGVDTYAVAIGNLHGRYPVPKQLDLDLLKRIREVVDCNLSLHGGSGTPVHYYRGASEGGISKVNINSDLRFAFRTTLEKVLADNPDQYAIVKLMGPVYDAVQEVVQQKMYAIGSIDKAVL